MPVMLDKYHLGADERFANDEFFNQTLFESTHFKVIPSLGSLVEGWLLILPKMHFISLGAINDYYLYEELEVLIDKICAIVKKEYGDYIVFEHGPARENSVVGCGVDYAHLHIVPIKIDLIHYSHTQLEGCSWSKVQNINSTADFYNQDKPYLFVQDRLENLFIGTAPEIPSQAFRKIIAEHLGIPDKYDWKQYPFLSNIRRTIEKFASYKKEIIVIKDPHYERDTA